MRHEEIGRRVGGRAAVAGRPFRPHAAVRCPDAENPLLRLPAVGDNAAVHNENSQGLLGLSPGRDDDRIGESDFAAGPMHSNSHSIHPNVALEQLLHAFCVAGKRERSAK